MVSSQFYLFDNHSRRLKLWDDIFLTDKCCNSISDIKALQKIDKLMFIFQAFYDLKHLFTKDSMMTFKIVGKPKIITRPKWGNTGKSNLTRNFGQASNEPIEGIIDTVLFLFFVKLLLCLKKYSGHGLHQIIDKNPESSGRRKSACRIVRLKNKPHLFKGCHIISYCRRWYLEIIFFEEILGAHDFSCFQVFFNNKFENLYFAFLNFWHISFRVFRLGKRVIFCQWEELFLMLLYFQPLRCIRYHRERYENHLKPFWLFVFHRGIYQVLDEVAYLLERETLAENSSGVLRRKEKEEHEEVSVMYLTKSKHRVPR